MGSSTQSASLRIILVDEGCDAGVRLRERLAAAPRPIEVLSVASPDQALVAAHSGEVHAVMICGHRQQDVQLGDLTRLSEAHIAPLIMICCADPPAPARRLLALGIEDILHLEDLTGARLCRIIELGQERLHLRRALLRAQERARTMHAIVAALAAACTEEQSLQLILDGVRALGAPAAALVMLHGEDLILAATYGYPTEITTRFARFGLDDTDNPISESARTRTSIWVDTHADLIDRYSAGRCLPQAGTRCALPLLGQSECLGVLGMTFPLTWSPEADDRLALETLASQCAQSLERTRLFGQMKQRLVFDQHLLGTVAHDLRNPLSVISLSTQALARGQLSPERTARALERIQSATTLSSRIVNDLLDYTAVQTGGLTIRAVPGDLLQVVTESTEEARLRAPGREISLSCAGDGRCCFDAARLQQVLSNLLSNALTYGAPEAPVLVRTEGTEDRVYVEVNNRGPVIPRERLGELFSPMTRGSSGGERGSLGLGLSITRGIVESHGGRLWASSEERTGTTFTVELPRDMASQRTPRSQYPGAVMMVTPPAVRRDVPAPYVGLMGRLGDEGLKAILLYWLSLGGDRHLPHPGRVDRARILAYLPDMVFAAVEPPPEAPLFRLIEVGGALERRLGRGLVGQIVDQPAAAGAEWSVDMYGAYRRCHDVARPVYDYLVVNDEDAPGRFERLVLPLSQSGGGVVTHLAALIRFVNLSPPATAL